ncbi:hypothetical protein Ahy_A07g031508 [Arachis hypogaea]|uniref:Ubiquitin-like protease family profile domain-containing protein n=1 Tax=Arachis hypogaea TaxID=3818 RepID=A0A445C468_ARAHY|nr:hypothetical protein Ahy_A07g031508 [Arachis hypogaea]
MAARNQAGKNQTKDLKCATHLLSEKFRNMSEEKKMIVRDLGFGGLMHIPPLRVHHQVLRELDNNFKLGENRLKTGYGSFKITPKRMGDALDIKASGDLFLTKFNYKKLSEDNKEIFRRFQGKTLKSLTDEMMDIGVGNEQDRVIINSKKRKKSHEDSDAESESTDETQSKKKKVVVEHSSSEEDQSYHGSEIGSEDLDEFLRENNENSAAQGEKEADLRSTEGHYVSSETIPDVNLGSDDPSSQGHTTQSSVNRPTDSIEPADLNMMVVRKATPSEALAIVPIQVCLPVSQTTAVPKFEETPETKYEPTPLLQIEGTTKITPEPPQELEESTPTLPPAPSKINSAPEDVAALMMMARTASYVPKKDPLPSFSLGFTDSSQEETTTQEGASTQDEHVAKTPESPTLLEQLENLVHKIASGWVSKEEKSPQIPKESGAESFEKFETPVRPDLDTTDMKQKCYHWAIRVKSYPNERTDEFDDIGRLQAGDIYTLSKFHLASLVPKTHIEAEIVYAMCFILNQQNIQRFQEEVYCLPLILWVEDYPMFIPFLDLKKLASHRYGYVISRLKVYAGGTSEIKDKDREILAPYLHISGQKISYDCAIYVMKWLEIFEPANIKRRKYEWENWSQDEVDHFRVEYASRILFHDMNLDKHEAIRGSNEIRLSKPSSLLLSPYCQIGSEDVDTA